MTQHQTVDQKEKNTNYYEIVFDNNEDCIMPSRKTSMLKIKDDKFLFTKESVENDDMILDKNENKLKFKVGPL